MKPFVRELVPIIVAMITATLLITALAGGSETVFYLASIASLAGGLWWEVRRGAL